MPQMSGIDLIKKIRELKRNDNIFNCYIHSSFLEWIDKEIWYIYKINK